MVGASRQESGSHLSISNISAIKIQSLNTIEWPPFSTMQEASKTYRCYKEYEMTPPVS